MPSHHQFIQRALEAADHWRGFTAPNPAVGAVVVVDQQIIATGAHAVAGGAHAEVVALRDAREHARGSTLYVTLEPCCHVGKTPPCTQAIIDAGVARVIYAFADPNPVVRGNSEVILRDANIECEFVFDADVARFYQSYQFALTHKLPFTTAKLAITLDGKIAHADYQPANITSDLLQQFTHHQRLHSHAILTTAKTLNADNAQMNVRLPTQTYAKPIFIYDSQLQLRNDLRIYNTAKSITIFHSKAATPENQTRLRQRGCQLIEINETDFSQMLQKIYLAGVHELWIEAGGLFFQSLLPHVQRAHVYVAVKTLGVDAINAFSAHDNIFSRAKKITWQSFGVDALATIDFTESV